MNGIRVWAPAAGSVELVVGAKRSPMRALERGWWHADLPPEAGSDYGFALDGGEVLPDPRSGWQPHGVHGMSRRVDPQAFRWSDSGWQAPPLASGVIYELHIGSFTPGGTFESAIGRLDHLVELGITHVELMPVVEFPGAHGWGYDGVDLFAPHHAYGGPKGLNRLVDACHARGLAVLLDVVYNHLGPDGNYLARFGPYFTERYSTPWGPALNFDSRGSDEVRRFLCDNACMWLRDYHFDGLRLDAVHAIFDRSPTHFLEQLAQEVDALASRLGRHLVLIAESDANDPRFVTARNRGGYGLAAQWSDDLHHALHAHLTGERTGYYSDFGSLGDLAKALRSGFVYDGRYSPYRDRVQGRSPMGLDGAQFVVCLQNHDQIGNRAQGERIGAMIGFERLKLGAALMLCSPFVPLLFQGEEWGASTPFLYFTDHQNRKLARAVREGRRREFAAFGWDPAAIADPQAPDTFARSRLDWNEALSAPHRELLNWYKSLISLRRQSPDLCDPRLDRVRIDHDESAGWLTMQRGAIAVAANLSSRPQRVELRISSAEPILSSSPEIRLHAGGVDLPPDGVAIARAGSSGG